MPVPYIHKHTHISIYCQQSQRWVISPMDFIKKTDLSSSALPSSFLSPGQSSTTLPGHLPTGLFPSPARTRSLQSACPFAYPSLLSHLWDSLPLRAAHAACPDSDREDGLIYLTDARKRSVTFTYVSANVIMRRNLTYGNFINVLACIHQVSKRRYIYLQNI